MIIGKKYITTSELLASRHKLKIMIFVDRHLKKCNANPKMCSNVVRQKIHTHEFNKNLQIISSRSIEGGIVNKKKKTPMGFFTPIPFIFGLDNLNLVLILLVGVIATVV